VPRLRNVVGVVWARDYFRRAWRELNGTRAQQALGHPVLSICLVSYFILMAVILSYDALDSGISALSSVLPHVGDHVAELNLNRNELYTLDGIAAYSSLIRVWYHMS